MYLSYIRVDDLKVGMLIVRFFFAIGSLPLLRILICGLYIVSDKDLYLEG